MLGGWGGWGVGGLFAGLGGLGGLVGGGGVGAVEDWGLGRVLFAPCFCMFLQGGPNESRSCQESFGVLSECKVGPDAFGWCQETKRIPKGNRPEGVSNVEKHPFSSPFCSKRERMN